MALVKVLCLYQVWCVECATVLALRTRRQWCADSTPISALRMLTFAVSNRAAESPEKHFLTRSGVSVCESIRTVVSTTWINLLYLFSCIKRKPIGLVVACRGGALAPLTKHQDVDASARCL
uniref:Putative secreted protein n=1 Tax=Ixodes ricinus TaxID=34613 RepID=A0A6B0UMZ9_IXORI